MSQRIPLIHTTDLYHPPQDPDDHIDLLTAIALPELDLKAVILDCTQKFLDPAPVGQDIRRDPGLIPIAQLGYLLGTTFPAACAPTQPLRDMHDDAADRPLKEQAGIELILRTLADSPEPVFISVMGSARALTAAFNRAPELVTKKTRGVLLNAGSTSAAHIEWNVQLDPAAFEGLWHSGLPILWYPCCTDTGAFNPDHERGTFYRIAHEQLLTGLLPSLLSWIYYAFTASSRGDILHALTEPAAGAVWEHVRSGRRSLWSTASLVMASERVLAATPDGWRFMPKNQAGSLTTYPLFLDPVKITGISQQKIDWQKSTSAEKNLIFRREPGAGYGTAMAEALNALLKTIAVS
jgi:pyrimidine-specific ribonucleoside hydrolase